MLNSFALVLFTAAPAGAQPLAGILSRLGLIGDPVRVAGKARFLVGDNFLSQVGFLGCSPDVTLSPQETAGMDDSRYVHVSLEEFASLALLESRTTRAPRCPHCRQAMQDWPAAVQQWHEHGVTEVSCSHCGTVSELPALDWRRTAGFARQAIYIWNVHEGEAIPADILMTQLEEATGSRWQYCYLQVAE